MEKMTTNRMAGLPCVVILLLLVGLLGTDVSAQCFGSSANLVAAASAKQTARAQVWDTRTSPPEPVASGSALDHAAVPTYSIVGLWHVHYIFPNMDQEAFQAFEAG